MNSNAQAFTSIKRTVGLTNCDDGYNSLRPVNVPAEHYWESVYIDFDSQSFHPYPAPGMAVPAWCPAYRAMDNEGYERDFSDLMVVDLHGCSAGHLEDWLIERRLAGLVHPTRSDSLTSHRSRLILVLDRPVPDATYRRLWNRMAHEVFADLPNAAHADFRQRYDQPHSSQRGSLLRRIDGNPLNVDAALGLPSFAGDALGRASEVDEDDGDAGWGISLAPRNR